MPSTTASLFDLSPSEKLLLVEDLWDDLAATSEAIPVRRYLLGVAFEPFIL